MGRVPVNTLIALLIIAAWCWLIWVVNQCLKAPTIYERRRPR